ncbi:hypothetical protein M758_6G036700 [Ceratodon purpureus]|nr:hypothetical protein M758_6G036700 [Ceratodon purpureus]
MNALDSLSLRDHKLLPDLGTPARNHIKFKENSSDSTTTFKKPQKKVSTVGHERPDFRTKVSSSSVSQMPCRGTDTARLATQELSVEAYKRLVRDIVGKSHRAITEESVKAKLTLPTIYSRREFNWMPQGRFNSILNGARAAMEWLKQGVNWEDAKLKCARDQVFAIHAEESHLRTFLAPTLHGKRYTSYGRHFTKVEKLKKVVEVLEPHIRDGDTIVDFSCGDNTFARLLLDALSNSEKSKCQFKNFDIFTPKDTFGFERRDWLSVRVNECGPGDNLVIGLNPPFMYTDVFINHALSMNPRVLVFIIPPLKKPLPHYGFECVLDDPTTMAEKSFYLPGSVHGLNDDHMEQGNHVAPHLYIFVRAATFGGSNSLSTVSPPWMVNSSLSTNPSQQLHKSEKRVNPATPTPESDPTANLFIRGKRSWDPRRPQHMVPKIMSGAPGFGSHTEEAVILPPPPPVTPYLPPPPPPPPPPFRYSQVHDSPRDHLPPHFRPQHHPELRPPHPLDEPYSPFEPALFPSICGGVTSMQAYVSSAYQAASAVQRQQHEFLGNSYQQMMALRQQQHLQQHQHQQHQQQQQQQMQQQQQHQGSMGGTQQPSLQWNMPERAEATLQDFMESNPSQAIVPAQMTREVESNNEASPSGLTAETFTNQSEQAHGSTSASNWHQAHHHAQAYANSQYSNGFFNQSADAWK